MRANVRTASGTRRAEYFSQSAANYRLQGIRTHSHGCENLGAMNTESLVVTSCLDWVNSPVRSDVLPESICKNQTSDPVPSNDISHFRKFMNILHLHYYLPFLLSGQ
jgi:hypothetical protein